MLIASRKPDSAACQWLPFKCLGAVCLIVPILKFVFITQFSFVVLFTLLCKECLNYAIVGDAVSTFWVLADLDFQRL